MKDGTLKGYPDNAFIIASADSLDFIHSFARIYCGNQQSSWHGTTVQLVQPQPSTHIDTNIAMPDPRLHTSTCTTHGKATCDISTVDTSATRHSETPALALLESRLHAHLSKRMYSMKSPTSTPGKHSPLPKCQRRMRTGTEGQINVGTSEHIPSCTLTTPHFETPVTTPTVSIDFRMNVTEEKSLTDLKEVCNTYMVQKVASTTHSTTFLDLQSYLSVYHNLPQPERSNVIYYKVLHQQCDDKETLLE